METKDLLPPPLAKHGMRSKIARGLGISPQAVGQWKRVPAERVIAVAEITGIPARELRPDLYPDTVTHGGKAEP